MASVKLSRNIKLTGTDSVDPKSRTLRAGPISVEFGNGALRYIRVNDVEVIRAIAFLVRDKNWGTYTPEISDLKLSQKKEGFGIRYKARCGDAKAAIVYDASIVCDAEGNLEFAATATPEQDFTTNRTGFVVLHPLKGVAGAPVEVEYIDGKKEKSKFPALVNPVCPFTNIRALKHKVMDGLSVTCRMDGYAFEMEDHRNWSDASFKTYVRPLAEPWPYTMPAGRSFTQKVSLTFTGKLPRPKKAGAAKKIDVTLGRASGAMPELGVAVPMEEAKASVAAAAVIKAAGPKHLVCHVDGRVTDIAGPMQSYKRLADATGAAVILEVLLPGKEAAAEELARVADAAKQAGLKPAAVSTSPAVDLKGTLPGSKFPDAPSVPEMAAAVKTLFPGASVGGGMFSFFTELNRKRPPVGVLHYVTHTTSPIVHAADDVSVMETLEAHPYQIKTTRSFMGKAGYHLGPSTIPARNNPYGASSVDNPNNERVCLSKIDPRQRGIFGAAWSLGYVSAWAKGGVEVVTLGATTGSAGMVYRTTEHAQPYFDGLKGTAVYPVYHLIADLAKASGAKLIATEIGDEGKVAALAYRGAAGPVLWLANLTAQPQTVRVQGFDGAANVVVLDEGTFVKATTDLAFLEKSGKKTKKVGSVALRPYAVTRIAATKV
jgi:D-apionolactonase